MELIAYAVFIIVLAAPFLVIGAIASAFIAGIAGIVAGIAKRRLAIALLGVLLTVVSGAAALVIQQWVTTPPTDASTSAHRVMYQTYQQVRMQFWATRELRRLAEEKRARDAERRAMPRPPG